MPVVESDLSYSKLEVWIMVGNHCLIGTVGVGELGYCALECLCSLELECTIFIEDSSVPVTSFAKNFYEGEYWNHKCNKNKALLHQ